MWQINKSIIIIIINYRNPVQDTRVQEKWHVCSPYGDVKNDVISVFTGDMALE